MSTNAPFVTVDLGLAAFLYAIGHPIEVAALERDRKQFEFPAVAECDVDGYYKGAPVSARAYFSAIRDVKSLIHRPAGRSANPNTEVRHAQPLPIKR